MAAIIESCARLPLAIVAARAAMNPALPLATLADELRRSQGELDVLDTGDDATNVRAVFSWSHRAITPEAARLFRLLGLHAAPETSTAAAVSLAARPIARTKALPARLHRVNLVDQCGPDRYRLHDLLWTYARELAERHETERLDAVHRVLDHYLHTAYAADRLLEPVRDPITPRTAASTRTARSRSRRAAPGSLRDRARTPGPGTWHDQAAPLHRRLHPFSRTPWSCTASWVTSSVRRSRTSTSAGHTSARRTSPGHCTTTCWRWPVLSHIGDAYCRKGDTRAARPYYLRSLEILDELGDPTADALRARLQHCADAQRNGSAGRGVPGHDADMTHV